MNSIIAFSGDRRVALGQPVDVAIDLWRQIRDGEIETFLAFDTVSSQPVELDLRGSEPDIRARMRPEAAEPPPAMRGRPKLGVISREVTLLPQQWDWLSTQSGGASAAIRRLVNQAQRSHAHADALRSARESLYRFMKAVAGNRSHFEDATRALFAADKPAFLSLISEWPADIRTHLENLAVTAFAGARTSLARLIPQDRLAAVETALGCVFGEPEEAIIEPLAGGASGAIVLKVACRDAIRVLRLDYAPDGFRDPARQYACHAIAAQAGVAPALAYADRDGRVSVSAFLNAEVPPPPGDGLLRVAQSLTRLHASPLFPPFMPFMTAMAALLTGSVSAKVLPAGIATRVQALFHSIQNTYRPSQSDIVSSHNDLNPNNVIFAGGRACFVDWESAFAADRYVDLATAANFFAREEGDSERLLAAYFGRKPEPVEMAKLEVMRQVIRIYYGVMLLSAARRLDGNLELDPGLFETSAMTRTGSPDVTTAVGQIGLAASLLRTALAQSDGASYLQALHRLEQANATPGDHRL
ncbi:MAG: DUF2239 family protein [Asticcacaulis sp.]